ncbi:hypothetical protein QYM36_001830, partial [Artemia franciscana]
MPKWTPVNERLIYTRFWSAHGKLLIIACYAPINEADEIEKDNFYETLQSVVAEIPRRDIICVVGDLNAKVGSCHNYCSKVMGQHGIGDMNENGALLVEFALNNDLVIGESEIESSSDSSDSEEEKEEVFQTPEKNKLSPPIGRSQVLELEFTESNQVDLTQEIHEDIKKNLFKVDAYDDFEFVMPAVRNYDWKPIPLSALESPMTGKLRRPNWEEKITRKGARLDGAIESAMHQGFLCHSVIYKSICETNFFRVKYTTYKIEQKRAYEEDCLAEYVKEQQGVRVTNHFPPFKKLVNQYKKEDETRLFPIYENVNTILHEMLHIFGSTEDAEEFTFTKKKKEWTWNNPETSISSNFMGANLLFDSCLED